MNGDHDDNGKNQNGDEQSFANLMGTTREISRGPVLAEPPAQKIRVAPRRAGSKTAGEFRFPDPDEPRLAAGHGVSDSQLFELQRGDPEPAERIDLHGLRQVEAGRLIAKRLESGVARGLRCVSIIHGQGRSMVDGGTGEAVLRDSIPGWLSKKPSSRFVLAFAPAPARLGGGGATLVMLRRLAKS